MKKRYFIEISFKGTAYNGWQIQPNASGIQQVIEDNITLLLREKTRLTGAGRTDTGVHASYFVAHFDTVSIQPEESREILRKLNHMLPNDIAILNIFQVKNNHHSRFSALSRTYRYYISTLKNPFRQETSYHISKKLNINEMNKAASLLPEYSDFSSFCRSNSGARTHICNVFSAYWENQHEMQVFTIKADRFLRNMVRAIVGTMLDIGNEKMSAENFRQIIEARDRRRAGMSAPAHGLFLTWIDYPDEIMELGIKAETSKGSPLF